MYEVFLPLGKRGDGTIRKAPYVLAASLVLLIVAGAFLLSQRTESNAEFKKSVHYVSNTPAHDSVLAGAPVNVVVDFDFDLGPGSAVSVKSGNTEYGVGESVIDMNKLALRRNMDPNAPDGLYLVNYKACWPDGSCHDGFFRFSIDRKKAEAYADLRGMPEVTVKLVDISIMPQNIRISRGTKVTWINEDNIVHYVNTDQHSSHTYFPQQNSMALSKGGVFSMVFDTPGIYPYHCSAHPVQMSANVLVG